MKLTLVTAPTTEIVTLAEAKVHCRVDSYDLDGRIAGLILSAREWAQAFTGRHIRTQTWDLTLDSFPIVIEVPAFPVQSITSIKYDDANGVEQTLSAGAYQTDLLAPWPTIEAKASWPATYDQPNAVRVRFVSGYADNHPDLSVFREAMLLHVEAHLDRDPRAMQSLVSAAQSMLWPLRLVGV